MFLERGRPVIEGSDHPVTVIRALLGSLVVFRCELPEDAADRWTKTSADARETLQDAFAIPDPYDETPHIFNPDGQALLYMSPGTLEYALVAYGCTSIESAGATELTNVEQLLKSLDNLK